MTYNALSTKRPLGPFSSVFIKSHRPPEAWGFLQALFSVISSLFIEASLIFSSSAFQLLLLWKDSFPFQYPNKVCCLQCIDPKAHTQVSEGRDDWKSQHFKELGQSALWMEVFVDLRAWMKSSLYIMGDMIGFTKRPTSNEMCYKIQLDHYIFPTQNPAPF